MTNMQLLKKSRKAVNVGDIFVFKILPDKYHWGRVVSKDAVVGGFPNCTLVYIYKNTTKDKNVPKLDKEKLLIPPKATNELAWRKGFFETIENRKLQPDDRFDVHCFEDTVFKKYRNEYGEVLDKRIEPCGHDSLASYLTIDDTVSDVLGIPLVPESD